MRPAVVLRIHATGAAPRPLRDELVDAVIRSGRAVSETALGFAAYWWMVRGTE
ncbi:hypothetical protein [Pseudarthrobacter sp. BRE9]|uniref:hypothetical protein n=1 Tax=Pseudarthrobacter sp. BRE9 TaxID=2962582 RepID=UPI00288125E9|nr:hypothetical protein [Pseudarthrobacter sp. BRE9]MDT0168120.1 hypothetical protein [Pseudarthrobacter sp. BRE9]